MPATVKGKKESKQFSPRHHARDAQSNTTKRTRGCEKTIKGEIKRPTSSSSDSKLLFCFLFFFPPSPIRALFLSSSTRGMMMPNCPAKQHNLCSSLGRNHNHDSSHLSSTAINRSVAFGSRLLLLLLLPLLQPLLLLKLDERKEEKKKE